MQINPLNIKSLNLPLGISEADAPLAELKQSMQGVCLVVPDNYEELVLSPALNGEVFAIQRLLAISRLGIPIFVNWELAISARLEKITKLQPLLAILVTLQGVVHKLTGVDAKQSDQALSSARQAVIKHKLIQDMFNPSQLLLCADSRGYGRPEQLYLPSTGALRPRSHFETLVQDVLSSELNATGEVAKQFQWAGSLGAILAELFENTDIHATTDLTGSPLSFNAMRGLIFKRIKLAVQQRDGDRKVTEGIKDCLEISVFDSGVGYFRSFTRSAQTHEIEYEWRVLHKCLERHFDDTIPDSRREHRALGLAEVLRKLQTLAGRIEIRTGRTFGYRTFIDGEFQTRMQQSDSEWSRFKWPKPTLLDLTKKLVAIPTAHEDTLGSAIRVIVPLS
jgi:hypothetical protein